MIATFSLSDEEGDQHDSCWQEEDGQCAGGARQQKKTVGVLGLCANIHMSVSPEPNGKALLYEK